MARDPTYVVEKQMFLQNSFPYLEVRRPFILGVRDKKWKPTIAHHFASLLHRKTNKLTRVYSQNIDWLTNAVNLPDEKIVSVHGTIGKAGCEACGNDMDFDDFCNQVETKIKDIYTPENGPPKSSPIHCPSCGKATVKPKTVLFGSSLPTEFFDRADQDLPTTDLLIVAGTSLVVSPANSLVYKVPNTTVRVVVNNEPVGQELGIDYTSSDGTRDFFARGDCDEVFLNLIGELGWLDYLRAETDNLPEKSVNLMQNFNS
jgi:NAD-dependent deacetylase sirtuin 2